VPNTTVEVGAFTGLTLDDPALGKLDENPLDGGIAFESIPQGLVGVSVTRGRSRDLERTNAGQLAVSLRNQDRFFDPLSNVSGFSRYVVPRRPIRVATEGTAVFQGFIDDWDFTYTPGGDSVALINASDAFSIFARNLNEAIVVPSESTGDRLNAVLDQVRVSWPSPERDIETGNSTLAAGTVTDNTLGYMQAVIEESEQGLLFMTKDGKVAFRERLIQPVPDAVRFSDRGTDIPYQDIRISYGSDQMVNLAVVEFPGGTAIAEDLTSQVTFGITEKTITTELSNLAQAEALADYVISRYSQPEYRIETVSINLRALDAQQVEDVLNLELGDQADVIFRPNDIGEAITLRNRIIGIAHDVGLAEHLMTFNFEQLPFAFFVLDDATFGKLDDDAGVLGF
jgi:hypothetical protein